MAEFRLQSLCDQPIDWRYKGIPPSDVPITLDTLANQGWNLFEGDLLLPVMLLKRSALGHNLGVMASFCRAHGVDLAPHGKTTMAPQLFQLQLDAGAWAITAATVSHVRIYRNFGLPRILLANEVVDELALRWLATELDRDEAFDILCLVDSVAAIEVMDAVRAEVGASRRLGVLVELGQPGGRTGCRSFDDAQRVASAANQSKTLELRGVEGFEGLIAADDVPSTIQAVDDFLQEMRDLVLRLHDARCFDHLPEILVTAGGSAYFDRVVAHLGRFELPRPVRTVLRSGCYLTHDSQMYEEISPLADRGAGGPRLQPALELWASVWSRPEPDRAIVGFGKRDAPYDKRMPVAESVRSQRTGQLRAVRGRMHVVGMDDQHAYVDLPAQDDLAVGDLMCCGISHPCTAFDKWRLIPLVDDSYTVTDAIYTFF